MSEWEKNGEYYALSHGESGKKHAVTLWHIHGNKSGESAADPFIVASK